MPEDRVRVVLFRHGIAGTRDARRWPDDGLRPLTARGKERTEQAARGLRKLLPVTRILSSPLLRATQTADILRSVYEIPREIELLPAIAPGGSYHEVIQRLRAMR